MKAKALYRADGSKKIGMGHLYRGFFVQKILSNELFIDTIFLVKNDADAIKFLKNKKLRYIVIDNNITFDDEIHKISNFIEEIRPCVAIVDVLQYDTQDKYTQAFKSHENLVVAITDDSETRIIDADIIINGNPSQDKSGYSNCKGDYYLGPTHFLMDSEYSKITNKMPSNSPKNLLITLGGSDHNNLIFKTIGAIPKGYHITVISSENSGYIPQLREHIRTNKNLEVELHIDVDSLARYWEKCDLAITAGGNTLFERIATRTPGATICQLERQMKIANKFEELGVNINFGYGPLIRKDEFKNKMINFLNNRDNHQGQYDIAPKITRGEGLKILKEIIAERLKDLKDDT